MSGFGGPPRPMPMGPPSGGAPAGRSAVGWLHSVPSAPCTCAWHMLSFTEPQKLGWFLFPQSNLGACFIQKLRIVLHWAGFGNCQSAIASQRPLSPVLN